MTDSDKVVQKGPRIPEQLADAIEKYANANDYSENQVFVDALRAEIFGPEVAEAEMEKQLTDEHIGLFLSALESFHQQVEQVAGESGAISAETVHELSRCLLDPVQSMARERVERDEQAETVIGSQQAEELDEVLAKLERETVRAGTHVSPDHGKVQKVAGVLSPEEVIDRLQERNPDVPPRAFMSLTEIADRLRHDPDESRPRGLSYHEWASRKKWSGVPEDEIETPVEERELCDERREGSQSSSTEKTVAANGGDPS